MTYPQKSVNYNTKGDILGGAGGLRRVSSCRISCSVGIWKALEKELWWLGFGMFGRDCPVSLVIDGAVAKMGYPDFGKTVEIEFPEQKQADLVQRVYDQRISQFDNLIGPRKTA